MPCSVGISASRAQGPIKSQTPLGYSCARPVGGGIALPLILALIGLAEFGALMERGASQFKAVVTGQSAFVIPVDASVLVLALVGGLVLAAVGAAVRLPTIRVWWQDGQVWRKGGVLTAML
jgi:hypothetical protein